MIEPRNATPSGAVTPVLSPDERMVGRWLSVFAVLILAIIVVGGATRLTESGLSITEWRPVSGVIPPMGEAAWQVEFEKYQQIPQYSALRPDMTMSEFRTIYLWEYGHRLVARLVGLVFILPLGWMILRRRLPGRARGPLLLLLALLATQAAMGWWMVRSGLSVRTEVSQYRLALHLVSALAILALTVWTAADMLRPRHAANGAGPTLRSDRPARINPHGAATRALAALLALVLTTAGSGALVAGLRAGRIYNTFPLMGGRIVPPGYAQLSPWWVNLFENPAAVQFNHRVLAITTFVAAVVAWAAFRRSSVGLLASRMRLVLWAALLQLTLGILTLLLAVPVALGVAHQGVAALLMVAVLLALHESLVARVASVRSRPAPAAAGAVAGRTVGGRTVGAAS